MNNNLINGGIAVRGTDLARKSPFTPRWHDDVSMVSFPLWHHENGPDPYTATLADAITTSIDAFGAAAIASIKSVASRSVMHSDEDTHHTIYGAGGATVVHSDSGVAAVEMSERHSLHVEQIHAGLAEQSAAAAVSPAVPYTSKGLTLAPVSVTDTIHIPAGGAVELTSSYSGTVMFDGATGTLKIDNSSDFHGTIAGQLTTGNMIDFADITAGANAKMTYSGDNSPGTLTVSDGTHTASIDLLGKYVLANFAASSDGHSGTSVVDPPVLPAGVTLKPIDGSQTYYADHGFTNAVNMGWDNPNFFAIGPWESSYNSQTDVNTWAALGWNTAFTDGGLNLSLTASHGISVIDNSGGANVVGNLTYDEPSTFAQGVSTPLKTTANSIQDGRFWWMNDQTAWIEGWGLSGAPGDGTPATILSALVTTPNGTARHVDINSADLYWFAGSRDPSWKGYVLNSGGAGQQIYNLPSPMTADQAQRGSNYGDMIDVIRGYQSANPAPVFSIIEDGQPFTGSTNGSTYITPAELNWATWSSLIHGARGVIYFDHSFSGPGAANVNVEQSYYQTVQPGQTISIDGQIAATDALIKQLAPVLNSQFAMNYVTAGPAGYTFGTPTLSLSGGIETMAKDYNGQFYIFADTRDSETQTNIPATFTLADKNATSVTVVNENRTIAVTNGIFSDTFATAATVHIYEVNSTGSGPVASAPVFTSGTTAKFAENGKGVVYTAAATEADGSAVVYSLGGADASLFNIVAATGVVTFKVAPDFETPHDVGGNNVYDIVVTASGPTLSTNRAVAITVTDVPEGGTTSAPVFTSGTTAKFAENGNGVVYTAAATEADGSAVVYSLGGADASLFNIVAATGVVTFKVAPDFETPHDVGGNNVYDIVVTASGPTLSTDRAVAITVTDVPEGGTITGTTGNDTLNGTGGSDVIDGGAGNDTLNGLGGNDRLIGGIGADVLNGGIGADLMQGGAGNDVYFVDNVGDIVNESIAGSDGIDTVQSTISFSLADTAHVLGAVENLTLLGSANINATGNALGNVLTGNTGNNVLNGGAGADKMAGGAGNDVYIVDNVGDIVNESLAGSNGTDTVQSTISFSLADTAHVLGAVENLTLLGTGNINATGNALNNVLTGNAGVNVLKGGAGNDTYVVNNAGDKVLENAGEGTDTVRTALAAFTLSDNVENLVYTGGANFTGTGNGSNNAITGGVGSDHLSGGGGNDVLAGGAGSDVLTGGAGNDQFMFNVVLSQTGVDTITDFHGQASPGSEHDRIVLSNAGGMFSQIADGTLSTAAFVVSSGGQAHDSSDRIIYDPTNGWLTYDGNGSSPGGNPIHFATLQPGLNLQAADFLVI